MPDQSSAAREHALIEQINEPLQAMPEPPVPFTADVDFPIVLRGYDRFAVDAYVANLNQQLAELQATNSPDAAVRRALERVGEEVSGVLQQAHETAGQITTQSRSEAEDRLETARREAAQITADARERLKQLDVDTDRIWAERDRIVTDARELARELVELADGAAGRFPAAEEPAPAGAPFDAMADLPGDPPADAPAADLAGGVREPAPDPESNGHGSPDETAEHTAVLWPADPQDS
jgi:vacuolar-type H+-ATPase subunit H